MDINNISYRNLPGTFKFDFLILDPRSDDALLILGLGICELSPADCLTGLFRLDILGSERVVEFLSSRSIAENLVGFVDDLRPKDDFCMLIN